MSKEKFIILIRYSLILGAILGVLSVVPYLILITLVMVLFMSVIVIALMQRKKQIGNLTIKGGAILGATIGFIGLMGFLFFYLPLIAILGAIFGANNVYFSGPKALISIWWLLIIMGGLLSAIFNSFALLSYVYIKDTVLMIGGEKPVNNNNFNNVTNGDFLPRDRG